MRALRDEPYSQKEAELAAGLTTDNGKRVKMQMEIDGEGEAVAA